jgi:transcriptional regulator with XRE-family HTH domain
MSVIKVFDGWPWIRYSGVMILRDLLTSHGILTNRDFAARLGLTKQYASLLRLGKVALSGEMIKRLHHELHLPLDALMQVERAVPIRKRGRTRSESHTSHP